MNMAFAASQLPAGSEITFHDVGRSIALWVSAFEILVHPRVEDSGWRQVYDLLERAPWKSERSRAANCSAFAGRKRPRELKNTACWLYGELYRARNDFLHGNPVEIDRLTIEQSGQNLFHFAAPLYRMALTAFLPLLISKQNPWTEHAEECGGYMAEWMDFMDYQEAIKDGLLMAHEPLKR